MLILAAKAYKRVRDCNTFDHGLLRDHVAVKIKILISSVKHDNGETKLFKRIIDWDTITDNAEYRGKLNKRLEDLGREVPLFKSNWKNSIIPPQVVPALPLFPSPSSIGQRHEMPFHPTTALPLMRRGRSASKR